MEEGNLAKWHVKEGDSVASGDIIAEIETDKATMEVEAIDEGTIAKIAVAEGTQGVKVNAVIAVLVEEGEDASAVDTAPSAPAEAPKAEEPKPAELLVEPPKAAPSVAPVSDGKRVFASPLARRIAEQNGVDLSAIAGSGPHGRIVKSDVEGKTGTAKPQAADAPIQSTSTPMAAGMSDDKVLAFYEEGKYESLPHDGMRRAIASRLTESNQTIPSYNLTMECELDALLKLRKEINSSAPIGEDEKPAFKISVNDFIIKAMALALRDVPMANASWTSEARILHKHSDVGVAVAIADGLITPIVREAELKTLSGHFN
ncbi:Dihydrolipoyllysine-residue acetyltransferase component of pyruvate dehydrogenase complex [Nymphon striatum]|nr:Dihydrolipoyllysine-residue acetyltransferase component of pyruvate dehydrogenase complex [Nymphon striatum]